MKEDEVYHLPALEKPQVKVQTLEEFADEAFWKVWDEQYYKDMHEVYRLRHPEKGACQCRSCMERNQRRFSELAQKWFGEPGTNKCRKNR